MKTRIGSAALAVILVAISFLSVLAACGGAQTQAVAPAAAPAPTAEAAPAAVPPKLGPNFTPDGVVFNFKPDSKANKIFLAGNFNGWKPDDENYLMKDADGDGIYSITVKLAAGSYQYKFVADGKWTKDPESPGALPDGYGGMNGSFTVK